MRTCHNCQTLPHFLGVRVRGARHDQGSSLHVRCLFRKKETQKQYMIYIYKIYIYIIYIHIWIHDSYKGNDVKYIKWPWNIYILNACVIAVLARQIGSMAGIPDMLPASQLQRRWGWPVHYPWLSMTTTLWLCQNSYWKWPFIVDLPINSMVIFHSYVSLPEGIHQ